MSPAPDPLRASTPRSSRVSRRLRDAAGWSNVWRAVDDHSGCADEGATGKAARSSPRIPHGIGLEPVFGSRRDAVRVAIHARGRAEDLAAREATGRQRGWATMSVTEQADTYAHDVALAAGGGPAAWASARYRRAGEGGARSRFRRTRLRRRHHGEPLLPPSRQASRADQLRAFAPPRGGKRRQCEELLSYGHFQTPLMGSISECIDYILVPEWPNVQPFHYTGCG